MVKIRPATLDDRETVFNLLRQLMSGSSETSAVDQDSVQEAFGQVVDGNQGDLLLAEEGEDVRGLVT